MEEAVAVDHADDRRRAEVDQAVAVGVGEALGLGRVGLVAGEVLHGQQVRAARLPVDPREDHVRLVLEVGLEGLGVVGLQPQVHLAQGVVDELVDQPLGAHPGEEELEDPSQQPEQRGVATRGCRGCPA